MKSLFSKRTTVSACLNFLPGAVMGVILFYAQKRVVSINHLNLDKSIGLLDIVKQTWTNMLWFFSMYITYFIFPSSIIFPILLARGSVCAFSASYILNCCGIKEMIAVILPQCLCILPIMLFFSVFIAERGKKLMNSNKQINVIHRMDFVLIFIASAVAAALEFLFFRIICGILF